MNLYLLSRLLNSVLSATFVSTSLFFSRVICEVYLHMPVGNTHREGRRRVGLLGAARIDTHVCIR